MEVLQHRELRTPTSIPMNEGDQGLVRWSDLSAYEGQEFPPLAKQRGRIDRA